MRRTAWFGAICFLLGLTVVALAATGGLRPDQFIARAWTWTGIQTFVDGKLVLAGASSGSSTLKAPATSGGTATLPAGSGTLVYSTGSLGNSLTNTHIFVGNGSNVAADVPLSGNCSMANTGAITCTIPISTGVSGLGSGVATFLATPNETNLTALIAGVAYLDVNQSFTKGEAVTPTALTDAATIAVDASLSNNFTVTLGGNRTLGNPTNLKAGQTLNFWISQDSSPPRTLAYDTEYQAAGGTSGLALSTTSGAKDLLTCVSDTTTTLTCALVKGIAH